MAGHNVSKQWTTTSIDIGKFRETQRVRIETVHKLLLNEDINILPTVLDVKVTALGCLRDRANIRPGESVLIHSGSGAFGLAAINIAKPMGATVYTTVGSQSKREYPHKTLEIWTSSSSGRQN